MKYQESTFEEYVKSVHKNNYHPEIAKTKILGPLKNLIYYGPRGVGKYSQMLAHLAPQSPTKLKYQKKMTVETEKGDATFHFSDIHYEIDMGLLGCNAKIIWETLFHQIVDMVSVKSDKTGILVCKNFHQIHSELLDIFFLYFKQFQQTKNILFNKNNIVLKYILLSEHVSFIPQSILHSCTLVAVARPSKQVIFTGQSSQIREMASSLDMETVDNLKDLQNLLEAPVPAPVEVFQQVCQPLLQILLHPEEADLLKIRENLYNVSIYHLDYIECLWFFLWNTLQQRPDIVQGGNLLQEIAIFLKYYNNNYRTIYHFENIFHSLFLFLHRNRNHLVI